MKSKIKTRNNFIKSLRGIAKLNLPVGGAGDIRPMKVWWAEYKKEE
jgi:hypothetical protein